MKYFTLFMVWMLAAFVGTAQSKYFTKTGKISFYSKSPMENIEAVNNKAVSVWDISSGQIEFGVLLKGFEFEKALMQEHFNENYVESDKYPKAVFKGVIENSKNIALGSDNTTTVTATGTLSLHGVTNPVSSSVTITVKSGQLSATSNFSVVLADYNISIPSLVAEKISKRIAITITVNNYQPMPVK